MTVSAQTPVNRSTGNGVTTVFPYQFKIISSADIEVTVDDVVQTLNVDYTVSGAGVDAGGNVTMTTAPANLTTVVRRRNMALVRTTDYQDQGTLPAATLDSDIDATVLMVQQLDERLDRTFSLPASFSGDSTLPAPQAGYLLGWDATAENLTNIPATIGTSLVDLAASSGSSLSGHLPAGAGAVATTVRQQLRNIQAWTVNVKDAPYYAVGDGVTDDTAACQAAVTAVVAAGGGTVYFPAGVYLLNGTAGADSYANGILIPMSSVGQHTAGVRLLGAGTASVLRGNANNLCIVRASRNFTTIENLLIDGQGGGGGGAKTNVIGVGFIPQNITQTTTMTDQSYGVVKGSAVQNCTEGIQFQPGPQIAGADSGCFYYTVDACDLQFNTRGLYFAKNVDWAAHPNRTTRTTIRATQISRGNCGTYIDAGTEIYFFGVNYEFLNSGATPLATPTGLYVANNASVANIYLFGGYAESCNAPVNCQLPTGVYSFGFSYSGVATNWQYVESSGDFGTTGVGSLTIASSGGGAATNVVSNTYWSRNGRSITFYGVINFDKGTLAAGTVSLTGLPRAVKSGTNAYQYFPIPEFGLLTLTANYSNIYGRVSPGGSTISLLKGSITGFSAALLTVAEFGAIGNTLVIQSTYLID